MENGKRIWGGDPTKYLWSLTWALLPQFRLLDAFLEGLTYGTSSLPTQVLTFQGKGSKFQIGSEREIEKNPIMLNNLLSSYASGVFNHWFCNPLEGLLGLNTVKILEVIYYKRIMYAREAHYPLSTQGVYGGLVP